MEVLPHAAGAVPGRAQRRGKREAGHVHRAVRTAVPVRGVFVPLCQADREVPDTDVEQDGRGDVGVPHPQQGE